MPAGYCGHPWSSPGGSQGSQGTFLKTCTAGQLLHFTDKKMEVQRDDMTCSKPDSKWQGQHAVLTVSLAKEGLKRRNRDSILVPLWWFWCQWFSPEWEPSVELESGFSLVCSFLVPRSGDQHLSFFPPWTQIETTRDPSKAYRFIHPRAFPFVNHIINKPPGTEPRPL